MPKYNSSNKLPSVDLNNKALQQKDLEVSEKFVKNFLRKYAGFTTAQIKDYLSLMQNKEISKRDITQFCKINFPGKRGKEYIEKLEPVMQQLNEDYRKNLKHVFLGV